MEQEFQEIDSKNSWNSVYQKIRHKSNNYDYTCKDARRMDNKSLNRYRDVNPSLGSKWMDGRFPCYIKQFLKADVAEGRVHIPALIVETMRLHFDGGEVLRPVCCAMSVHVKEPQVVKISGDFHYGVFHNQSWFWDVKPDNSINQCYFVPVHGRDDHSRVILKRGDKDYINASLVKVKAANRTYILTQGPLPTTTSHFWLMVWEQQTKAILMLNRIIEKNTVKCHQYWPMSQDEELVLTGVGLKVAFLGEKPATNYTVRELMLTDLESGHKRVVLHLHYTTWPDFGVPESPAAFLAFLQAVRESGALDVDVGPPVVHCSAGIGRSGTFCLVDSCLVLIEANGGRLDRVDVQEVLLEMRKYRMGLIQTPDQLRFSYLAILEGARALSCCQQKDAHPTADERALNRSPEHNGITEESSESEATDSSDDEDDGDDEDTVGGGRDVSENGEGSARLPTGAGDSPPPLPPRLKRSSEENSNSSSEAKDLLAGEPGAKDTPPRKSTGEEAELRKRQRRERVERTSQMLQRMRQKQRSSEAWLQRRHLLKRVSIGLALLLGTGVLVYKYYDSGK